MTKEDYFKNSPEFSVSYYRDLEQMAIVKYGSIDDKIRSSIDSIFLEEMSKVKDVQKTFYMPYEENKVQSMNFIQTMDYLKCNLNAIFSFNGIFKREKSPIAVFLQKMIDDRSYFKGLMLKAKESGDELKAALYDQMQKFKKEVANSVFGVLGLPSFFLFNPIVAGSITGNAATQLQILINQIEKIYGGRVVLRNYEELIDYINSNLIYSNIEVDDIFSFFNDLDFDDFTSFNENKLKEKLLSYCQFDINNETPVAREYLDSLIMFIFSDPIQTLRFYFLNDISKFLNSSTRLENTIVKLKDNICSLGNFNEKEMNKEFDVEIKPYLEMFLIDKSIQAYQDQLSKNYNRTTVRMSDTDSLFIVSKVLTDLIKNTINKVTIIDDRQDLDVFTFRILTYLASLMTDSHLTVMAHNMYNIGDEHRYKYKSEYFYRKLLLLKVKKTYIGLLTVQEGYKIPVSVDEKNIRKTSYTKPSTVR